MRKILGIVAEVLLINLGVLSMKVWTQMSEELESMITIDGKGVSAMCIFYILVIIIVGILTFIKEKN